MQRVQPAVGLLSKKTGGTRRLRGSAGVAHGITERGPSASTGDSPAAGLRLLAVPVQAQLLVGLPGAGLGTGGAGAAGAAAGLGAGAVGGALSTGTVSAGAGGVGVTPGGRFPGGSSVTGAATGEVTTPGAGAATGAPTTTPDGPPGISRSIAPRRTIRRIVPRLSASRIGSTPGSSLVETRVSTPETAS